MPIREMPKFKAVPDKMLEIPQPAIGGLNLKDLEFEQENNQSPYMMNVMYRNGAFSKRYGQEVLAGYPDVIYSLVYYNDDIYAHCGTKIYKGYGETQTEVASGLPEEKGLFIVYAQKLYYLSTSGFYKYDTSFEPIDSYVPEFMINCKPDGGEGADVIDDLNILGNRFTIIYNGTAGTTVYHVKDYNGTGDKEIIDWSVRPTIEVDRGNGMEEETNFTVDANAQTITFASAPGEGSMNVSMTFTMKADVFTEEKSQILSCKFYDTFGGANNSRLFVAGCGNSKYYYSNAYDISYFPENNFATVGNTEEDITGFGRQYNVLIVFKPREIYSIYSYTETSATTVREEMIGQESFRSQLVNARVGCDAPYSIQLINNLLTWFNSVYGVCTLVSTNIQDERNVRTISRNIERMNKFDIPGILDDLDEPENVQSADFNNRYFLVFPKAGYCYMWDYEISPYRYSTSGGETDPRTLDWFLFDHFYVKEFLKIGKELAYASSNSKFSRNLIKLNTSFDDLDFNEDGERDAIYSFYMTPFMQFGAVEMLKNISNIYVQCRGDTSSVIKMEYLTDETDIPEIEPEDIVIGGNIWARFKWDDFQWKRISWAITFRRKCNIKKVQMASFVFRNNEPGSDMSIAHIGLQYQLVKYVR